MSRASSSPTPRSGITVPGCDLLRLPDPADEVARGVGQLPRDIAAIRSEPSDGPTSPSAPLDAAMV